MEKWTTLQDGLLCTLIILNFGENGSLVESNATAGTYEQSTSVAWKV